MARHGWHGWNGDGGTFASRSISALAARRALIASTTLSEDKPHAGLHGNLRMFMRKTRTRCMHAS